MKWKMKKIAAMILAATMICGSLSLAADQKQEYKKHSVAPGTSKEGNPLKGLFPYESKTDFPISMEYFSLPVNAIQTGMEEYDWSALETKLNKIAGRGHQAVMRFYYDTPNKETGVPQFVIDHGLKMQEYDSDDLGGSGVCPDYSDSYFRESMQAFIEEFGKQYDGDSRIAFVTVGMLGFWGEWHNWPFDKKDPTKEFFTIPTEVQKEVLDAFDDAFDITKLCVREPKSGIDFNDYNIGFHDDSFAYETLSKANGGGSSHFVQKLINGNVADVWERECIGGEVYPPMQDQIFSGAEADYEDWDLCMEETHASWMLCNHITKFTGDTLENARKASREMGYDLQVKNAYYNDGVENTSLTVGIEMANIGVAPFYYDHRTWPVVLGVKQGEEIVKEWKTNWDLCDVASGKTQYFETSIGLKGLETGEYTLCMKVQNPLKNGVTFGFANAAQNEDGWLALDTLKVNKAAQATSEDKNSETKTSETQTGEDKNSETKTSETQTGEDKNSETKTSETQTGEDKNSETKTSETQNSEENNTNSDTSKRKKQKITTAKIKKYKAKNLKRKKAVFSLKASTTGDGKLTYKVTKYPKKGKKYIKVSKKGKVTLKKNAPKGTYRITITASETTNYEKQTKKITIKVK